MIPMERWIETLHHGFGQYITIDNLVYHQQTELQELIIFDNAAFGRVMALDGVIQTTERDEFIYHEMLTHVPLFAHGAAKKVLIIGGGDGAMLREVCRHQSVAQITMVEIDTYVIELCRQYLPHHNAGAYQDPRLKLIIDDGVNFVQQTQEKFDVIISDCTDPIGPGESLFTSAFYQGCADALQQGGIFVAQNGVCFLQQQQVVNSHNKLKNYFNDVSFYQAAIPTYYGGIMTFAWATQDPQLRQLTLSQLQQRLFQSDLNCRYYTSAIHQGSFALPQYLLTALQHQSRHEVNKIEKA